jgi:hypothetical protein
MYLSSYYRQAEDSALGTYGQHWPDAISNMENTINGQPWIYYDFPDGTGLGASLVTIDPGWYNVAGGERVFLCMIGRRLTPVFSEQNSSISGGLDLSAEWIMDVRYMKPTLVIIIVNRSNPLTVALERCVDSSLDIGRFVPRVFAKILIRGVSEATRLYSSIR